MFKTTHALWVALLGMAGLFTPVSPSIAQTGLQFDGTDDYVTFGQATSTLGTPTFTIEVWFMRTGNGSMTSTGGGGLMTAVPLLAKGRGEAEGSNKDCNYFLGIQSNRLAADFEDNATGGNHPVIGVTTIQNNVWYHAAATFDGTTFRLYLNGILEGSVATSTTPRYDSIQHASIGTALNSSGTPDGAFAGLLDEARIWSYARTQTQIHDGALVEIPSATGLLGRWGLNDGSGFTAANSVAGSPSGTLTNGATWVAGSPFAYAYGLKLAGTVSNRGYVSFGDPAACHLSAFTIETWFRRDGSGLTASTGGVTAIPLIAKLVAEADGSNLDGNYFLGIDGSTAKLVADFEEGAAGATPGLNHPVTGVTTITNGTWYHAAAAYDGTTWSLYLNGNLEAQLAVGRPVQSNSIQYLGLGAALTSTGTVTGALNGVLDEARIWNVARTQAQIQGAMNTPFASPQPGLVARWGLDEGAGTVVRDTAGSAVHGTLNPAPVTTAWGWIGNAPFNAVPMAPPTAPSGLTATPISTSQIDLSWSDNATTETSYEVERSTTGIGGPYGLLVSLPAGSTGYSNLGLSASTEYCYRVHAVNAGGVSGNDGPMCATTPAPPPPDAPTNLVASATAFNQAHLTWTDNANNESGYEVERSTTGTGGPYSLISSLGANTTAFDDTTLSPLSTHCYRVRAVSGANHSGYATPACATTPGSALDFRTPASTYVTFGDPDALDLAQFTVEFWFRRDGVGSTTSTGSGGISDAIPLVTHGAAEADGDARDMNFFVGISNGAGVLCADFEEGPGGSGPLGKNHPILGVAPVGNIWHHAAATYDGTTWRLYLDGNLDASLTVGQPVRSNSIQQAALARSLMSTGSGSGFFNGALDEVRIWSMARTQVQVQSTINQQITSPTAGLVARWGLDEGTGTNVGGSAGTTVSGTISGASYTWITGAPFNVTYTIPSAPSGLTPIATTHTQIRLAWTDNSIDELGFEIERSTTGVAGPYSLLATVGVNTTSYSDDGLSPSSEYCYRIRAVNSAGASAYGGPSCVTTPAAVNRALSLSGSTAQPTYVNLGAPAALRLTAFTIELWVRRDGTGEGTSTGNGGIPTAVPLVAKGRGEAESPSTNVNYFLGVRATTGVLIADFEEGPGGTTPGHNHPVEGATQLALGVWYHVAATYDGSIWKLYLNGNLDASLPVEEPVASTNTGAVSLGSALTSANVAGGFFNGALDEVRIWNVARDQQTIQASENLQISTPTPGLVARWSLDEPSGTLVGATAGTTPDGTIIGPNYAWTGPGAPFNLLNNLPPADPVVVAPADDATGISSSPSLQVAVSDPESNGLTVKYYGRLKGPAPGPDFTIIGLPDTQHYTGALYGGTPAIFDAQTNWIVANRAARNIVYVGGLGDCVQNGDNDGNDIEWQRANTSLSVLETPIPESPGEVWGNPEEGIPFGVSVGNHDQSPNGDPNGTTDLYNQYFGSSRFTGRTYYGGHFGSNNDNWYELFTVSGMDFIVISLEYDPNPPAAVLSWAENLLVTHATRRAIVLSHFICNTGNPAGFGPQGFAIYNALKSHPNFHFMLCGHVLGEGRRQNTFNNTTVHTMLSDYQGRENGGNGWMRILEFSPTNSEIRVKTYSPWLDQYEHDGDSEFTLPYDMKSATPFAPLGMVSGVPSGTTSSLAWPGRAPGTAYEWYFTVSDGTSTIAGPVLTFRTAGIPTYTLGGISDPVEGGSVTRTPSQDTYLQGTSVQLTAVPNPGYHFVEWTGDLNGTINPQTLVMDGDKTATAHFALDTYTVTATAGAHGTIDPSGSVTVNHGADQTFAFSPTIGYHVASLTVDGSPVAPAASYTFTHVTANHSIDVQFAIDTYSITATAGANGTIDPSGTVTVNHGADQTFTFTPAANHHVAAVTVDGSPVAPAASYTFTNVTANHSIDVQFAIDTYSITATAGAHGTIDPSGSVTVNHGADQTFAFSPTIGYHVASLTVDGSPVAVAASYTFTHVTANHSIDVQFAIDTYSITATAGANGTIDPSGTATVNHGADQTFTFTPAANHHVAAVTVDGSPVVPAASYTFTNVTANHSIDVQFAIDTYTITATAGANGSIDPSGAVTVNHGADQTFTFTPAAHHHLASVTVDGSPVAPAASYTFTNVTTHHSIDVQFAIDTYSIAATAGANGTIDPSGTVTVNHGADQAFTFTPAANHHVAAVTVDGSPVAPAASYTFTNVTANHSIGVQFAINTYTITATAGANGSIDPSGAVTVNHGADQTFTFTPAVDHHVSAVTVDGSPVAPAASYTFTNVTASHTLDVQFSDKYTITATAGAHGTVDPSGAVAVAPGADQTFTFHPDVAYHVSAVTVDGSPVAPAASHTFTNVTAQHTLDVEFASDVAAVTEDRPTSFGLRLASSNPGFGGARFEVAIPEAADVNVRIYDTRGRLVRHLAPNSYAPGRHMLEWDARDESGAVVGSGIYFAKLVVPGGTYGVRLVLMR